MFPKVKELKSSQTHAISILSFSFRFAALAISRKDLGLNEEGKMVNVCVTALKAALCPQRGQECVGDTAYLGKLRHSRALNLNWRLRVSIKPLTRHSISQKT